MIAGPRFPSRPQGAAAMVRQTFTALLAAAALSTLAACSDSLPEPYQPKQPQVTQVTSLHAVRFAPEGFQVSPAERQRLLDFLARLGLRQGDRVMVELPPAAAGGEVAGRDVAGRDVAGRDVAGRRALAVMQLLARAGIAAEPFAMTEAGGRVLRVGVERVAVNAPADCPDWPEARHFGAFVNDSLPNFGCAAANNFAAMLANPRDAVEGRPLGPADAERLTLGLRAYRQGKNLPFEPLPASMGDE
ncbi:hypothetical protein AY600_08540 [Phormidium willei BDU 130791]|nr:hypothetical protein AY600_08540 [Phormidium willei BDU 130791]